MQGTSYGEQLKEHKFWKPLFYDVKKEFANKCHDEGQVFSSIPRLGSCETALIGSLQKYHLECYIPWIPTGRIQPLSTAALRPCLLIRNFFTYRSIIPPRKLELNHH